MGPTLTFRHLKAESTGEDAIPARASADFALAQVLAFELQMTSELLFELESSNVESGDGRASTEWKRIKCIHSL
jgi:hypothetical protein